MRATAFAPAILAPDYSETPYWWVAAPRPRSDPPPLPEEADVVIVGSGVTGLNAARELARAGRQVLVLDSGDPGIGASSRNAGAIGRVLKHEFSAVLAKFGEKEAVGLYREMRAAYDAVVEVVAQESIDCHFERCGRIVLAHSEKQLRMLEAEAEAKRRHLGEDYALLDRTGIAKELDTPLYVGALFIPESAALHPGLYHLGLLAAAERQGAAIHGDSFVKAIARDGGGFTVATSRGSVKSAEVIVATNGYANAGGFPWLASRLVPFDAYMIATDEIAADRMAAIVRRNRIFIDANRNLAFLRRSSDGKRLLFGSRTGSRRPGDLRTIAISLHRDLCEMVPAMERQRVAFCWTGRCAGTFDLYPHIGVHDGVRYAAGYCFAGVPMGTYLGRKLAWQVLGRPAGETAFTRREPPRLPLYSGNPWFVPYFMKYYDWLDGRDGGRPWKPATERPNQESR